MRIALFCHSLVSDWSHGNAHFLRGIAGELIRRGHEVRVFEPRSGWSIENLRNDHGEAPIAGFRRTYPKLRSESYDLHTLSLERALDGVDLVLVHEWNDPQLVHLIGEHRARNRYVLLFHDTHHRLITRPQEMQRYRLEHYDGVLAFGQILRDLYLARGLTRAAFTWHEAADTHVFHPGEDSGTWDESRGDLVWIGNWGDDERTFELATYLLQPVSTLGLTANVYGVRYPPQALSALRSAGLCYRGFLPNYEVASVFARHTCTVHVPRGPYVRDLQGVPTIRVFEALACGIPLISAPWNDAESLFTPGQDFLMARSGEDMTSLVREVLHDPRLRAELRAHGLATIRKRHTCAHRVDELFRIGRSLGLTTDVSTDKSKSEGGGFSCPVG